VVGLGVGYGIKRAERPDGVDAVAGLGRGQPRMETARNWLRNVDAGALAGGASVRLRKRVFVDAVALSLKGR